jgi:hypothetical protein
MVDNGTVGRVLLALGLLVAVVGLLMALGVRIPFGKLPGDISGSSGGVSWFVPLGTSLLVSVVLTVVINLVLRH